MIDKHLDVRNLIRLSNDVKVIKNLMFNVDQKKLFRKQARRHIDLDDSSSPVVSESSADEEYDHGNFIQSNRNMLLKWKFQSSADRKLILGMVDRRCVQLTKKKPQESIDSAINETQNVTVMEEIYRYPTNKSIGSRTQKASYTANSNLYDKYDQDDSLSEYEI